MSLTVDTKHAPCWYVGVFHAIVVEMTLGMAPMPFSDTLVFPLESSESDGWLTQTVPLTDCEEYEQVVI